MVWVLGFFCLIFWEVIDYGLLERVVHDCCSSVVVWIVIREFSSLLRLGWGPDGNCLGGLRMGVAGLAGAD